MLNLNNRYLGMVRQWQEIEYGSRYSESYMDSLPDFVKLAESYGHGGMRIDKPADVEPAIKEALALKDRLVFMDFITDQTENVWPMFRQARASPRCCSVQKTSDGARHETHHFHSSRERARCALARRGLFSRVATTLSPSQSHPPKTSRSPA